jgi:hypothetical protein
VNDSGQLYTIEGVAAAIMMVVTAYLVISSASIFTPQEKHVAQMQLEQMGHDALVVMDTPREIGIRSDLSEFISTNDYESFNQTYYTLVNQRADGTFDTLKYNVTIYYRDGNTINPKTFIPEDYHRENAVKVTQWVYVDSGPPLQDKIVLVEVLLWRD